MDISTGFIRKLTDAEREKQETAALELAAQLAASNEIQIPNADLPRVRKMSVAARIRWARKQRQKQGWG